jgi:hypothetical protein
MMQLVTNPVDHKFKELRSAVGHVFATIAIHFTLISRVLLFKAGLFYTYANHVHKLNESQDFR